MVSIAKRKDAFKEYQEESQKEARQDARPVTPMGLLVQQLGQIVEDAKDESITPELEAALARAHRLAAGLDPYVEACTTSESEALAGLTKKTQAENWGQRFGNGETVKALEQEMLSGHVEGQLLKMLVAISGAKRVLEIGMFTGYSALAIAEALPTDGYLLACEVDAYASEFARDCFDASAHGQKIEIKVGPALETMQQIVKTGETFDLAFIDADKGGYIEYCNLLLDTGLLSSNGFICVDNTLMQGQPYLTDPLLEGQSADNGRLIAEFNQFIAEDNRVEQVMIPLRDGFTIIKRR